MILQNIYRLIKFKNSEIEDSKIVKYLIKMYHTQWEKGYLESKLLSKISYFTESAESNQIQYKDEYLDYFSEEYLNFEKYKDEEALMEFIYSTKINQREKVELYDNVKEWEKYEKKLLEDKLENEPKIFENFKEFYDIKKERKILDIIKNIANKNLDVFLLFYEKIEKYSKKYSEEDLDIYHKEGVEVEKHICSKVSSDLMRRIKFRQKYGISYNQIKINIFYKDNENIKQKIKEYIINELEKRKKSEILNQIYELIIDKYYICKIKENFRIIDIDNSEYELGKEIEIGSIKFKENELTKLFEIDEFANFKNNTEDILKFLRYFLKKYILEDNEIPHLNNEELKKAIEEFIDKEYQKNSKYLNELYNYISDNIFKNLKNILGVDEENLNCILKKLNITI